jgi:tetratricopeptide (TPR) repeat protein
VRAVGAAVLACLGLAAAGVSARADTAVLRSGESVKGLVVEEHADRILLSTVDGERALMRREIERVEYDGLEYSLFQLGRQMEAENHPREALSYYEKAVEVNPELVEARQAALGIRSRIWAQVLDEGPKGEVQKQQDIQDSWRANVDPDALIRERTADEANALWKRMDLRLANRGEWVVVSDARIGGYVYKRGFVQGDALVALDGKSLRYLNREAVTEKLLEPRYANATLQFRRAVRVPKPEGARRLRDLGFRIEQQYNGLTVTDVAAGGPAAGLLKPDDLVVEINGELTRYMPLKEAVRMIEERATDDLVLTINRSVTVTRK